MVPENGLMHLCRRIWPHQLPPHGGARLLPRGLANEVTFVCRDEEIVFVGLGWHNDEHKMMHTFGFGRSIFCNFADVATVAHELG